MKMNPVQKDVKTRQNEVYNFNEKYKIIEIPAALNMQWKDSEW